jgi:hypothetical protein
MHSLKEWFAALGKETVPAILLIFGIGSTVATYIPALTSLMPLRSYTVACAIVAFAWANFRAFQKLRQRLREGERESEKALSREVYRPLHEELAETSLRVERRLYCNNLVAWPKIQASGLAGQIDTSTRRKLQHLYDTALPKCQAAWMDASQEWEQLGTRWDSLFGCRSPEGYNRRDFDWWNFLLGEECSGTGIILGTVEGMKIYNAYLTAERLVSGLSLEEFLRDRWNEATGSPRFATYRAARRETLREIKEVMEHLVCRMRV